jgi:hypothetical protein
MGDDKGTQLGSVLLAGLFAILGTVAGGLVKGCMDTSLADKKFQTDLVMKALEPEKQEDRVTSLQFLIETNLVSDPKICDGVRNYLAKKPEDVPQFKAAAAPTAGVVVPSTESTRGYTDFTVFVCDAEWNNQDAQSSARSLIGTLRRAGRVGQITLRPWDSYDEVPIVKLRGKLTFIVDKGQGEEGELPRFEQLLEAEGFKNIQVVANPGRPTQWLISIISCPAH